MDTTRESTSCLCEIRTDTTQQLNQHWLAKQDQADGQKQAGTSRSCCSRCPAPVNEGTYSRVDHGVSSIPGFSLTSIPGDQKPSAALLLLAPQERADRSPCAASPSASYPPPWGW